MLDITQLTEAAYQAQNWKNGKGTTYEIAVDGEKPFRWRASTATLEAAGPFSSYPGYDRTLVVLKGGPVHLRSVEGGEKSLPALVPYSFGGEWSLHAEPESPATDFNLFALRERAAAKLYVTRIRPNEEAQFSISGQEHLLFVQSGSLEVLDPNSGKECHLEIRQTLRISRTGKKEFLNLRAQAGEKGATVLWSMIKLSA